MRPIIPSPKQFGYRNRITVHAQEGVIGFFRRDSHQLIDIEHCPISTDEVNRALTELRVQPRVRDAHYTLRASTSPRVFSQTNDEVADALRDLVVDLVPPKQDLLIDAYCGAGFFAKALLGKFERVIGIDWDKFAIAAARERRDRERNLHCSRRRNRIAKGRGGSPEPPAERGNDTLTGRLRSIAPTTIIVDPPATGLSEGVRKAIIDLAPQR